MGHFSCNNFTLWFVLFKTIKYKVPKFEKPAPNGAGSLILTTFTNTAVLIPREFNRRLGRGKACNRHAERTARNRIESTFMEECD